MTRECPALRSAGREIYTNATYVPGPSSAIASAACIQGWHTAPWWLRWAKRRTREMRKRLQPTPASRLKPLFNGLALGWRSAVNGSECRSDWRRCSG